MRFCFTMNMPSKAGSVVHQVVADHPARSLDEMLGEMNESDFIMVEEYYKDSSNGSINPKGKIVLNCMMIGKVKLSE